MATYSIAAVSMKLTGTEQRWELSGTTVWDICIAEEEKGRQLKFPQMSWWMVKVGEQSRRKKSTGSPALKTTFFLQKEILLPLLNSLKIPWVCWWTQSLCDFNSDRKELLQRISEPWKRKQIPVVQNSVLGAITGDFPSQTGGEIAGRGSPRECKLDERGGTKHC